jgi:lysophospholipase L1-like esterase
MATVYCLGDSLTFGLGVRRQERWTGLAEQETGHHVVNLGCNGDTTGGMLARLQNLATTVGYHGTAENMPVLLIMGGSNDIFYAGTDTGAKANIGAMIHQAMAAHMLPVVGIPLPIAAEDAPAGWGKIADFHRAADQIAAYSQWLKDFCTAFGVQYVDFRQDFLKPDGTVRRELFVDGLHPNGEGHALMAKRLIDSGVLA